QPNIRSGSSNNAYPNGIKSLGSPFGFLMKKTLGLELELSEGVVRKLRMTLIQNMSCVNRS
ncbi:hypothetical protein, partial [Vibrio sp. FF145]|uniref:hypothetical protein n=1 Tax=Vibrio sp. FF145 TaxID=3230013 RepID=UPI00352F59F0